MTKLFGLFALMILFAACRNKIETSNTLTKQDFDRLYALNLLDKNEQLYKFYSEFKKSVAGNFFTNKRLASYWLDEHDKSKNKIEFAFYKDIVKIDTVYFAGLTYCPYLLITRNDNSSFKVCVEGKKQEITEFFNDAIDKWKQANK